MRQVCTDALLELGVVGIGEEVSADLATFALGKLKRIFNNWNAERAAVYATAFAEFTLVPGTSPHTIGPSGATFTVTQRPVSIDAAALNIGGSPAVYLPLNIRDADWWNDETVPDLQTDVPTDLYYQPDWPNGSIYFWPVPDTAYDVRLQTRVLLDETVTLDDAFDLPPGYEDAAMKTLAEDLAKPLTGDMPPGLPADAMKARSRIFANNETAPRLVTCDAGMEAPRTSGQRADFNYLNGSVV